MDDGLVASPGVGFSAVAVVCRTAFLSARRHERWKDSPDVAGAAPVAIAAAGPAVAMIPPRLDWQTPRHMERVADAPAGMFALGRPWRFDSSARP
jgi:hypothetical protein